MEKFLSTTKIILIVEAVIALLLTFIMLATIRTLSAFGFSLKYLGAISGMAIVAILVSLAQIIYIAYRAYEYKKFCEYENGVEDCESMRAKWFKLDTASLVLAVLFLNIYLIGLYIAHVYQNHLLKEAIAELDCE